MPAVMYLKGVQPGELIKIDTGCVVVYTEINFDIQLWRYQKLLFGGEGLFFAL
jgi:uncharacterized protein (AIM24 family)